MLAYDLIFVEVSGKIGLSSPTRDDFELSRPEYGTTARPCGLPSDTASKLVPGFMTEFAASPGVSALSAYFPPFRVSLEDWCGWTDNSWEKIRAVVGKSFRICGPQQNVYTMAASAVLRLIEQNDIDPRTIGFLGLGTESSTDNAAGAVIVRGMVDRALDELGKPRLPRRLEVPEFKHACLGGMYALKGAMRYVATDGAGSKAIVVASDVAEYERGTSGEQTQGAGAVAMLVEAEARLFEVELAHCGTASDYRGPDFRKPFARHFSDGYAARTQRVSDFPIFSGKYSTFSYLDETVHAVEDMLSRLNVSAGQYYRDVSYLFFHRPYQMMPIQAMSFLYVRGLVRGDNHQRELSELCAEAGVDLQELAEECASTPDLYGAVLAGNAETDPYRSTSKLASLVRRRPSFRELLAEKMSLGSAAVAHIGNLYTAALPAWLAAGMEAEEASGQELLGAPMVAVGYGSGDAAEAWPVRAVPGWQEAARNIRFQEALAEPVALTRPQYEALHDGGQLPDLNYSPRGEFVISRVGETYESSFQDLALEYYDYIR